MLAHDRKPHRAEHSITYQVGQIRGPGVFQPMWGPSLILPHSSNLSKTLNVSECALQLLLLSASAQYKAAIQVRFNGIKTKESICGWKVTLEVVSHVI